MSQCKMTILQHEKRIKHQTQTHQMKPMSPTQLIDQMSTTTTIEISSDAIKGGEDFSKSDTTATKVKTKSDTTATEVAINTDTTVIEINTDTTHDSSITDDQNKTPGDLSKMETNDSDMTVDQNQTNEEAVTPKSSNNEDIDSKPNDDTPETNDSDMTVDPNQTNEEVVTPKSPNNENIDSKPNDDTLETNDITPKSSNNENKMKEKVVPTVPDGDSNRNDDDNNNEIDKTPGDPDNNDITPVDPNEMKEEEEGAPVIDITNDEVNGDIVTPKEPISKSTPSLGVPDKKNEESYMDVLTALEYLAKVKAYMNRPKKIKEYIDHQMKMEECLVEQFLDKSDVTKGPEIGLFVFLFSSLAYSVYVNLCGNCKSIIDAV